MVPSNLLTYIRKGTGTDANTPNFSDADVLGLVNVFNDDFAKEVIKTNEDIYGVYAYESLVAGQREYAFPNDILTQVKMLEGKLTLTGAYVRFREFDLNGFDGVTDEAAIVARFGSIDPEYDIFRQSIFLYTGVPILDIPDGLRLWYIAWPRPLTTLTEAFIDLSVPQVDPLAIAQITSGLPRTFHELLGRRVIIFYKEKNVLPLSPFERNFDVDFKKAMDATKGMNLDREVIAAIPRPYADGFDL